MENIELLPCPFCGGKGQVNVSTRKGNGGCDLGSWLPSCTVCPVIMSSFDDKAVRDDKDIRLTYDGRTEAIKAWDKRVEIDAL